MCRKPKKVKLEECLDVLHDEFNKFQDPRAFCKFPLHDILMSSYAIFALKFPSLLSFERAMEEDYRPHNIRELFKVTDIPSDTQLRDVVDVIETKNFRKLFTRLFALAQRSKLLERYEFTQIRGEPYYLISADGSGYFRSDKVGCQSCNSYDNGDKKKNKKYGHNILGASLVHPDRSEVISFCPEAIITQDGVTKNDCEQNAFKRFIPNLRREHPKLNAVLALDALYATEPPIKLLFEHEYSFIIGIKETNGTVYDQVKRGEQTGETKTHEYSYEIGDKVKKQVIHRYRYRKNVHIKQDPNSTRVNFVEFWEEINWEGKRGQESQKRHFAWITDLEVNKDTIVNIMKGGRARWKIENETFNTLKNQGYHLEHNYGHGKNYLSVNFIMMMFLAFLIDQLQQASCQSFKKAVTRWKTRGQVWKEMAGQFQYLPFKTWDQFFGHLTGEIMPVVSYVNSS